MATATYNLDFDGYWRDENKSGIPNKSGIYCVYECKYNKEEKTVTILKLIYIGESDDVGDRIAKHEKRRDWLKHVGAGNELCYSFAGIGAASRERAEAAMIFEHKPIENTEYVDSFPYDTTTINLSGKTAKLHTPSFTVYRT